MGAPHEAECSCKPRARQHSTRNVSVSQVDVRRLKGAEMILEREPETEEVDEKGKEAARALEEKYRRGFKKVLFCAF